MTPFSAPGYSQNEDRCRGNETPCAYCGKGCKDPWTYAVHVVEGGARFATKDEHEGRSPIAEGGDMYCFPVGVGCASRLTKAGVHVFAWKK